MTAPVNEFRRRLERAAAAVAKRRPMEPRICVILGSGLGDVAKLVAKPLTVDYADAELPPVRVEGHAGQLVLGDIRGVPAIVFVGRSHIYEGISARAAAFSVFLARELGAGMLFTTNAAGGVNAEFAPGELMALADHINLSGQSPLVGAPLDERTRFVDMSDAYDRELRAIAKTVAAARNIPLREGVYAMLTGPAYETLAEVRMLRMLGADAVGMSTVPEVLAARHEGMRVFGLSIIANRAADVAQTALSHAEVLEAVRGASAQAAALLEGVIEASAA